MSIPVKHTHVYRDVLREIARSSKTPRAKRDQAIPSSLRAIISKQRLDEKDRSLFDHDIRNAVTFMKAQREHKKLIDRYNPMIDFTNQERMRATARRVGLDMPVEYKAEDKE